MRTDPSSGYRKLNLSSGMDNPIPRALIYDSLKVQYSKKRSCCRLGDKTERAAISVGEKNGSATSIDTLRARTFSTSKPNARLLVTPKTIKLCVCEILKDSRAPPSPVFTISGRP